MKEYPLEIKQLYGDGGDACAHFSKGHHDPALFVEAIYQEFGDRYPVEQVEHTERRWQCSSYSEYDQCLMPWRPETTRRGVFPVTIIEW